MSESPLYPWWVVSDPDHPVNAGQPVPEVPLMSESEVAPVVEPEPESMVPPHITEAIQMADSPSVSPEDREHALEILRAWDDAHKPEPIADAHPSTIPGDLIPAEYQAKASE